MITPAASEQITKGRPRIVSGALLNRMLHELEDRRPVATHRRRPSGIDFGDFSTQGHTALTNRVPAPLFPPGKACLLTRSAAARLDTACRPSLPAAVVSRTPNGSTPAGVAFAPSPTRPPPASSASGTLTRLAASIRTA